MRPVPVLWEPALQEYLLSPWVHTQFSDWRDIQSTRLTTEQSEQLSSLPHPSRDDMTDCVVHEYTHWKTGDRVRNYATECGDSGNYGFCYFLPKGTSSIAENLAIHCDSIWHEEKSLVADRLLRTYGTDWNLAILQSIHQMRRDGMPITFTEHDDDWRYEWCHSNIGGAPLLVASRLDQWKRCLDAFSDAAATLSDSDDVYFRDDPDNYNSAEQEHNTPLGAIESVLRFSYEACRVGSFNQSPVERRRRFDACSTIMVGLNYGCGSIILCRYFDGHLILAIAQLKF